MLHLRALPRPGKALVALEIKNRHGSFVEYQQVQPQWRRGTMERWRISITPVNEEGVLKNMPIPESQLSGWSHHGPQQASINTHEAIRKVLAAHRWPTGMTYDFYLQGSYRNNTNLPGDSDVDVVLELNSVFRHDWTSLSQNEPGISYRRHSNQLPTAGTISDGKR